MSVVLHELRNSILHSQDLLQQQTMILDRLSMRIERLEQLIHENHQLLTNTLDSWRDELIARIVVLEGENQKVSS